MTNKDFEKGIIVYHLSNREEFKTIEIKGENVWLCENMRGQTELFNSNELVRKGDINFGNSKTRNDFD